MITKNFTMGEIEQVLFDPSSRYLEDRITEEYPKVEPKKSQATDDAKAKLNDLFGG